MQTASDALKEAQWSLRQKDQREQEAAQQSAVANASVAKEQALLQKRLDELTAQVASLHEAATTAHSSNTDLQGRLASVQEVCEQQNLQIEKLQVCRNIHSHYVSHF